METLKFDHSHISKIKEGILASTIRIYYDKNSRVGDKLILVDKYDPMDRSTWRVFAEAKVTSITHSHLSDFISEPQLRQYKEFYGQDITMYADAVKIEFIPHLLISDDTEYIAYGAKRGMQSEGTFKLFTDGGSRGNPGPSAGGFILLDEKDHIRASGGVYLGVTTNNLAEYEALKAGLIEAMKLNVAKIEIYMDSTLVVNQMRGVFKVSNRDLWPIHDYIVGLLGSFKRFSFTHIPRELNKRADAEVNKVLDEHTA